MREYATIGAVVIGRNEGERLRRCLRSIPEGVRVVYVDSASTDASVSLARQHGAAVVQLDLARPFTAARARNEGFDRLLAVWPTADYVQFIDGDCELEPGWLELAVAELEEHAELALVCGRRRERFPDHSFYNRLCDDEWNTPIGPSDACGGDALMRVGAIRGIGAYDPAIIAGEEPEMCARLRGEGWRIWRLDAPMTIHDAAMDRFGQWWKRAVRGGYGYAQVCHKTLRSPGPVLYGRELIRAAGWTIGVPAAAVGAAFLVGPTGLVLAPVLWLAQLVRLSARHGTAKGAHLLAAKAAECIGAVRYIWGAAAGKRHRAIYYK